MCGIWALLQSDSSRRASLRSKSAAAWCSIEHGVPRAELNSTSEQKEENATSPFFSSLQDFLQLAHRGPDHLSFEHIQAAGLTLGFHRLAIVNPSVKGNQPFVYENPNGNTVYLLCNGEIYNYKELLASYPLCPYLPFSPGLLGQTLGSDCEVLLRIYTASGVNGLVKALRDHVKGEFAFVLFELDPLKRVKQVVAGRDAIGVRPLYVTSPPSAGDPSWTSPPSAGDPSWTSPPKAGGLLFTSELKGALHYDGDMMEFPPGTMYHYTVDPLGQIQEPCMYTWTDSLYSTPSSSACGGSTADSVRLSSSQASQCTQLRQAILNSVQRRLEADRPLAFLLSGGIDSSLVAGLSSRLLGKPIRTFCCTLSDEGKPIGRDIEYAREVATHLGSEHTEVLFTKEEALAAIPDVIRTVESWDTTTIRASVGQYLVSRWIGQNTDCKVVLVGEGPDEVCSSYLFNWYAPTAEALDQSARDYVKNIHLYDGRRADRCIARWGLEARVPFLDPEFIQAYWQIPAEERMPKTHGIEKWWLREVFKDDGVVPERVRMRMKDAFSDSISGQVSWTQMIQEWITTENKVTDEEFQEAATLFPYPANAVPQTKEAFYYRRLFEEFFGPKRASILPGYWQPRWNKDGEEVQGYVDPSARTLSVYSELTATKGCE